jgi:excisionase family DNA binding protein
MPNPRAEFDRLLTVADVMEQTQLGRRTILGAIARGELVAARFGNRVRIRPDALRVWLERAEGRTR